MNREDRRGRTKCGFCEAKVLTLIMDVLIIKKTADVRIDKNIGRIFKSHNVFEYKSEDDSLSIWDYNKVAGYAMIYSAFNKISIRDITINFVITLRPIKLLDYQTNDRGFDVDEASPGIYYVKSDAFAVQIIESKKLNAKENVFLKNLRSNLTKTDLQEVLDAFRKFDSLERVSAYLNRIMDANELVVKEVMDMSDEVARFVVACLTENGKLERLLEESGTLARARVDGEEKKTAILRLKCCGEVLRLTK